MAQGLVTIGTYAPYPSPNQGLVTIGFYGTTPPTIQGVITIGTYGNLSNSDNSLFFAGD